MRYSARPWVYGAAAPVARRGLLHAAAWYHQPEAAAAARGLLAAAQALLVAPGPRLSGPCAALLLELAGELARGDGAIGFCEQLQSHAPAVLQFAVSAAQGVAVCADSRATQPARAAAAAGGVAADAAADAGGSDLPSPPLVVVALRLLVRACESLQQAPAAGDRSREETLQHAREQLGALPAAMARCVLLAAPACGGAGWTTAEEAPHGTAADPDATAAAGARLGLEAAADAGVAQELGLTVLSLAVDVEGPAAADLTELQASSAAA